VTEATTDEQPPIAPDGAAADEETTDDETAARNPLTVALAVIAVVFLAGTIVMGVIAVHLKGQVDKERSGRRAVERAASRFGDRFFTYDYRHLDQSKAAVLVLSTGAFKKNYAEVFDGGLGQLVTQAKAVSTGTVKEVFVSSVEGDNAAAVLVADATITGTSGTRRMSDSYIRLDLVKVRGQWLVDQVTDLEAQVSTNPSPLPSSTSTTTTAPRP